MLWTLTSESTSTERSSRSEWRQVDQRPLLGVATCVFCSVADPVEGLRELGRVTKPEGQILLLEHVRPRNRVLGRVADLATALTRRLFGFRANRRTEANVAAAGLKVVEVRREGVWREIVAQPDVQASDVS